MMAMCEEVGTFFEKNLYKSSKIQFSLLPYFFLHEYIFFLSVSLSVTFLYFRIKYHKYNLKKKGFVDLNNG